MKIVYARNFPMTHPSGATYEIGHLALVVDGDEVVAHATVKVQLDDDPLTVGFVGTHPDRRKEGLQSRLWVFGKRLFGADAKFHHSGQTSSVGESIAKDMNVESAETDTTPWDDEDAEKKCVELLAEYQSAYNKLRDRFDVVDEWGTALD